MEGTTDPQTNEPPSVQAIPTEGQNQWPLHVFAITYELRGVYEGTIHEAPASAVTTRAVRRRSPVKDDLERQENYSSYDVELPQFPDLEKEANAARQTTKALARGNDTLDDLEEPKCHS